MRIVPRIVLAAVGLFISALIGGRILHPKDVKIHPSGEATFIIGEACVVSDLPADPEQDKRFRELLSWCEAVRASR